MIKKVDRSNSLPLYLKDFCNYLLNKNYHPTHIRNWAPVYKNFGCWIIDNNKSIDLLDSNLVHQYLEYRKENKFKFPRTEKCFMTIISFLIENEIIESYIKSPRPTIVGQLIDKYEEYLTYERFLTKKQIHTLCKISEHFLKSTCGPNFNYKLLSALSIRKYIIKTYRSSGQGQARLTARALRSLLRWLYLNRTIKSSLDYSIPVISRQKIKGLPKPIMNKTISILIRKCDQRTHTGRRSYAILLLLSSLGLRSQEICNLTLDCIDWRRGEVRIESKGSRGILPLPENVGKALISYLKKTRPNVTSRKIFIQINAPHDPLGAGSINRVLLNICKKTNIAKVNPHQFRHTIATQMLNSGSSLKEIGLILRHKSPNTTAIYAKIDDLSLKDVVSIWPGGVK